MIDRRTVVVWASASALLAARVAAARPVGALPTLGVLQTSSLTGGASARTIAALRGGLRELGYVEGHNIVLLLRSAEGRPQALPGLATELIRLDVDVLLAFGPAAVRAAQGATRTLPIVALDLESDPVHAGWARSLGRPGGNVTGLFLNLPELAGKWFELMREALPHAARIGLLWDSTTGGSQLAAARDAARRTGIDVQVLELRSIDDMGATLAAAVAGKAQAVVVLSSPITRNGSHQIAEFVARAQLPGISPFRPFAEAGGLMSYGPDLDYFFARTASFADKILRGVAPGELPIEQPARFELVVNMRAARALGLTIASSLLLRADEVIE